MKKNNYLFILKTLLLLSMILFTACNHGLSSNNKVDTKKGIIHVSVNTSGARTISPSIDIDAFDTFILKGKLGSTGTEQTLAGGDTVAELNSPAITLDAGTWTLTLTADLNGVTFSGTQSVTVSAGSTTPISFTLEPTVTTGAASIKINFSGDSNKVTLKFYQAGTTEPTTGDDGTITTGGSGSYVLANYTNKAAGTYILKAKFDKTEGSGANQKTYPLNTVTLTINVAAGLTTTHEMSIDLEEVYNITYHFIVNGEEVGSGTTIPDGSEITIASGALVDKYSRKGETFSLPTLSKTDYAFLGWYNDRWAQGGTQIGSVVKDVTSGDQDYYACLINTLYVDGTGNSGWAPNKGTDSLTSALNLIASYEKPVNWVIKISGDYTGVFEIPSTLTTTTHASSITIMGKSGNASDKLLGGNNGTVLSVKTSVPIILENLEISGGKAISTNGGGIFIDTNASVTLGNGAVVKNNDKVTGKLGGAVYVGGSLIMQGSASIPSGVTPSEECKNDVYLASGKTIKVSGELSTGGVVAVVSRNSNTTILDGTSSDISAAYTQFEILDSDATDKKVWKTTSTGTCEEVEYTETSYTPLPAGTTDGTIGTDGSYVNFGDYPRTIKGADVFIYECSTIQVGLNTYYLGSDGSWYLRLLENSCRSYYTYSDSTTAKQASANSYKYFKVEPIKWRILTDNYTYDGTNTGNLLLAETCITNCAFYDYTDGSSYNRTIGEETIRATDYENSRLRAYLNGLSYIVKPADEEQTTNSEFETNYFLNTVLPTSYSSTKIKSTNVSYYMSGRSPATVTVQDRMFVLSKTDVTSTSNGWFPEYPEGTKSTYRLLTDYLIANGAEGGSTNSQYGFWFTTENTGNAVYKISPDTGNGTGTAPHSASYCTVPAMVYVP